MDIKPIHNEQDYQATLRELATYVDNAPEPDTPDSDRLKALRLLVKTYETKHYHNDVSNPIAPVKQRNNPLHGVTLQAIVTALVAHFGWAELAVRIPIRCFSNDPSIASSLKFLRKTPWARDKVEGLYAFMLRDIQRTSDSAPTHHAPE